jgi:Tol biopolymer transport system component
MMALGVLAAIHFGETAPMVNTVRFKFTLPEGVTFTQNAPFAISPDGRTLAFPAVGADGVPRVWLHAFDTSESRPLAAAEVSANPGAFTWSPDSRFVLFTHDMKLKRAAVNGGPSQTIVDTGGPTFGAAWHTDGTIVFGTVAGLMQVPVSGGTPASLTRADASRREVHVIFDFLPDGRRFLFTRGGAPGSRGIYVGSLDNTPDEQPEPALLTTDLGATFVPGGDDPADGHLLFMRDSTLVAQPFAADDLRLVGEPKPIAEQVFVIPGAVFGSAHYSVSHQGTLVYRTGTIAGLARHLAWFSRDGKSLGTLAKPGRYLQLKLSPDASRLVASQTEIETGSNADIWITDLVAETGTRLTFSREADVQPTWSPDGRQIAWAAIRDGVPGLYRKPADGSGNDELLYTFASGPPGNIIVSDWSSDGRFLIYAFGGDVFALPIGEGTDASRQPIPVVQTPAVEFGPDLSPDSRWIVYISNESGRQELYVQPFAPAAQGAGGTPVAGKWMVSSGGTLGLARWRRDGRELMFVGADGSLLAIDVTATPVFKASAPRALFQLPRPFLVQTGNPGTLADITGDGQRLLLALPSEQSTRPELSVVLNWQAPE